MTAVSDAQELLERGAATEAAAVAEITRASCEPQQLDPDVPQALVIPADARVELPDLTAWRARPTRKTGLYRPGTVEALDAYVRNHLDVDHTTVWVHPITGVVEAVLDDNAAAEPAWGQHRARLALTLTPEWRYWLDADGKMLQQYEFAEHIEGGLQQIEQPDAADVLELAQSFHATNNATFRSSLRLASGEQQFAYDEELQASAGRTGQMTVPTVMVLLLAPFLGEDEQQVTARFRFRLNSGKLLLGYKLDQPEKILRDAIEQIADRIRASFPRVYIGEPAR